MANSRLNLAANDVLNPFEPHENSENIVAHKPVFTSGAPAPLPDSVALIPNNLTGERVVDVGTNAPVHAALTFTAFDPSEATKMHIAVPLLPAPVLSAPVASVAAPIPPNDPMRQTFDLGPDNDTLVSISSGDNSDLLVNAGAGKDSVEFGNGNDHVDGGTGEDSLFLGDGNNTGFGGSEGDQLSAGNGNDCLDGGSGDDNLWSYGGKDTLNGGDGNDYVSGGGSTANDTGHYGLGAGDDNSSYWNPKGEVTMEGGTGNDTMSVSAGEYSLDGGKGNDFFFLNGGDGTIDGGGGRDTIFFNHPYNDGKDIVRVMMVEFDAANDHIDFSGLTTYIYADGPGNQVTVDGDAPDMSEASVDGNTLHVHHAGYDVNIVGVGNAITDLGGVEEAANAGVITGLNNDDVHNTYDGGLMG